MKKQLTTAYLLLSLLSHMGFAGEQPNIVLFFVDDLGWSDLGYRNPVFESPNIDALAKEGLNFEQAYIASPTCSPSRATLLTGKHPARLKLVRHIPNNIEHGFDKFGRTDKEFNLWETDPAQFPCVNWLALEHTTYAEALKELGYYNLFVGKWHLGHEDYHPIHQGFDRQIGTSNAGHPRSYYPPYFKNSDVLANEEDRYLTDKLTDETVKFIEQYNKAQPFMLSFWYYSVHGPHIGRKDLVKHFEGKGLTGRYASMATELMKTSTRPCVTKIGNYLPTAAAPSSSTILARTSRRKTTSQKSIPRKSRSSWSSLWHGKKKWASRNTRAFSEKYKGLFNMRRTLCGRITVKS
jgi:hypothetical protein